MAAARRDSSAVLANPLAVLESKADGRSCAKGVFLFQRGEGPLRWRRLKGFSRVNACPLHVQDDTHETADAAGDRGVSLNQNRSLFRSPGRFFKPLLAFVI